MKKKEEKKIENQLDSFLPFCWPESSRLQPVRGWNCQRNWPEGSGSRWSVVQWRRQHACTEETNTNVGILTRSRILEIFFSFWKGETHCYLNYMGLSCLTLIFTGFSCRFSDLELFHDSAWCLFMSDSLSLSSELACVCEKRKKKSTHLSKYQHCVSFATFSNKIHAHLVNCLFCNSNVYKSLSSSSKLQHALNSICAWDSHLEFFLISFFCSFCSSASRNLFFFLLPQQMCKKLIFYPLIQTVCTSELKQWLKESFTRPHI